jgi:hypothetical protein
MESPNISMTALKGGEDEDEENPEPEVVPGIARRRAGSVCIWDPENFDRAKKGALTGKHSSDDGG